MDKVSPAEVCKETRGFASGVFLAAIKEIWRTSFSEEQLRDLWLAGLKKNKDLFFSGWYVPPPDGIGILIGSESDPERLNYESLRSPKNHPQSDIYFDPQTGLAYVYASPVDRKTGVIGDWGMTLYAGKDPKITTHLKKVYSINHKIVEKIQPGMKISNVYNQAITIFEKAGLTNNVTSITDTAGINIGHSFSGTLEDYTPAELAVIQGGNWEKACNVIGKRRVFFNGNEDYEFKPGDCFTLEPRLTDPEALNLPMASFHTGIRITENGAELLANFEDIFRAAGMDYML